MSTNTARRLAVRSLIVGILGLGGTLGAVSSSGMAGVAGAAATAVPNKCTAAQPTKPPSTGTQTPSGFTIQMPGATLAPASTANTLASAYSQFNDMTCTEYTHHYQFAPPNYYYYDCVGFTGYTTRESDPQACQSVVSAAHLAPGYVPHRCRSSSSSPVSAVLHRRAGKPCPTCNRFKRGTSLRGSRRNRMANRTSKVWASR